MIEEKNASIKSTFLGIEDHGFFTFYLYLDYGNSGQAAGGYVLDVPGSPDTDNHKKLARSLKIIEEILKVVGVEEWEKLPGKFMKVKADRGNVYAIQNVLGGEWLNFDEYFKAGVR